MNKLKSKPSRTNRRNDVGSGVLLGIGAQQLKTLRRIKRESEKSLRELEETMCEISRLGNGTVPQGLATALHMGKHLPLWVGMVIDA